MASLKIFTAIAVTSLWVFGSTIIPTAFAQEVANPLPAKEQQNPSDLFLRRFKVDATRMIEFLNNHPGEKIEPDNQVALGHGIKRLFEAAGVQFDPSAVNTSEKRKSMFFNDRTGVLLVRATLKELDMIESILSDAHQFPPQVRIEGKIIRIDRQQGKKAFDWILQEKANAKQQASTSAQTGIVTSDQFQKIKQALENQINAEVLAAPKVITMSRKQARISIEETPTEAEKKAGLEESGVTFDVLPTVANDGYTIQLDASITVAEKVPGPTKRSLPTIRKSTIAATVVVWDGQTAVFRGVGNMPGADEEEEIYVMLTPTIIDPAGNRVHSTDNLPYDPEKVPSQNGK